MTALLAALQAAQRELPVLPKDKANPHFRSRYTSLDAIVEKVGPILNRHGLVWTARPSGTHEEPTLDYSLSHAESGESLDGSMPLLLDKSSAQALGSALTYARRYSLCAVLNLVADEDDDGNAAGEATPAPEKRQIKDAGAPASPEQRKFLGTLLKRAKITKVADANMVLAVFAKRPIENGTADLTKGEASDIIERLKNGEVPSVQFPSDLPADTDAFLHPVGPIVGVVAEAFDAVIEEPAK